VSRKSIENILVFQTHIIEIFNQRIKVVSPLIIQLKNITEIFGKILEDNRGFSSFINISDGKESSLPELNKKIKSLEVLYVSLCRNFAFFVTEFFKFLDIKDNLITEKIVSQLINNTDTNKNFKSFILNSNEAKKSEISSKRKNQPDFYSEADNSTSKVESDLKKTMTLIHNIITNENYITVSIISVRLRAILSDSHLEMKVYFPKEDNYFRNMFNEEDSDPEFIRVEFTIGELLLCYDKRKEKLLKFRELKDIIGINAKLKDIKNDTKLFKEKLSDCLTKLMNDLFYFDNKIFNLFQIYRLLVIFQFK
jgi:hypothetical protein